MMSLESMQAEERRREERRRTAGIPDLLRRCDYSYSTEHNERWKNAMADHLNSLLGRATYILGTEAGDESDVAFVEAVLQIARDAEDALGIKRTKLKRKKS